MSQILQNSAIEKRHSKIWSVAVALSLTLGVALCSSDLDRLRSHVGKSFELFNSYSFRPDRWESESLFRQGLSAYNARNYIQAENKWKMALNRPNSPLQYARTARNLAILFRDRCQYDEAELLFKTAINLAKKHQSEGSPTSAFFAENLAQQYKQQGRYSEAIALYSEVLDSYRKFFGPNEPAVADILYALASCYREKAKTATNCKMINQKAVSLLEESLEIRTKILGSEHTDTLRSAKLLAEARK